VPPPLGLLALGGPLLDARHRVKLLDAEFGPMPLNRIISAARDYAPDAVLMGHSGSTSGHPMASRIARAVRTAIPHAWIIYGGVFPTYHWSDIMKQEPAVDIIVRGEGEETIVRLVKALEQPHDFDTGGCIQIAGGLVGQQNRRIVDQGARDRHALALSAG